jgi:hypothetical protein
MGVVTRLLEQRHAYYRALLALEVLVLIGLRGLQAAPRLVRARPFPRPHTRRDPGPAHRGR